MLNWFKSTSFQGHNKRLIGYYTLHRLLADRVTIETVIAIPPYGEIIKEIYFMKTWRHLMKSRKILYASFTGLLVFMLFGYGNAPSSSASTTTAVGMDLDAAVKDAATQMETRIPSGTMIALVSVASPSTAFSTQVLTRLESVILSNGKLVVVERAKQYKFRAEQL